MATAANPLATIARLISEASQLPPAEPYQPSAQPLLKLTEALHGREVSSAPAAPSAEPAATPGAPGSVLDATVGREVMRLVSQRPLSAEGRAEAVRRAAMALEHPTADNVRSVLAVLVSDRVDV